MIDAPAEWAEILAAHHSELVRTARARLAGRADAEDVVQEVVLRLLRSGRRTSEVETPAAYLRRAVVNECTSRWRRSGRDVLVESVPDRQAGDPADDCLDRIVLRGALAGLTERQRRVVTLSLLDDRADAEIAGTLGICEVTVRTTRLRALARLRRLLTEPAAVKTGADRRYAGSRGPARPRRTAATTWSTAA
jgi:RNA polymerase sigma factor (sigma-70 family)